MNCASQQRDLLTPTSLSQSDALTEDQSVSQRRVPETFAHKPCTPNVCAIMQPTFFPWAGYFNLLKQVDTFVFLDDVQFDRRSWQSRNRVFDGGSPSWLSCPTIKAPRDALIKDIEIAQHEHWQSKHMKKLSLNYSKTPFYEQVLPIIEAAYNSEHTHLADFNIQIIEHINQLLSINTNTVRASALNVAGKRSQKLFNLCHTLGVTDYLSPQGSKQYLYEDGVFDSGNIKLHFQGFVPVPYPQLHSNRALGNDFVSHLSIIDVIANIGVEQTQRYIEEQYVVDE